MDSLIKRIGKWFKKSAFGVILTSISLVFVLCVGLVISNSNSSPVSKISNTSVNVEDSEKSSQENSSSQIQVEEKIRMPFTVNAKISRYFFDSSDSIDIKSQALINYDNKFVPSIGVDYTFNNESFTVVNAFSGTVVEKLNDSLYGLSVVVENKDGLRAHYCGLSNVSVMVNDKIDNGQTIGKSGTSIINANLGNHLHFAIELKDKFVNPLKLYDKTIKEAIK
ncbi:MAG: M23 family metallopeptidase [Candidatus Caccosoma sp.]|nr:M23 family metallopeptidase [Candidatus Caccosoma sp.]